MYNINIIQQPKTQIINSTKETNMTNFLEGSKTLKPKTPIFNSVEEFTPEALNQDGIWAHAFDESNDIEIPDYLDNPIKTGLSYMDYILGDAGFYPTQCTILTGDPGCGKTTMTLEMASAMRGLGANVAFASCEMRREMVAKFQKRLGAEHPIKVITDKIVKTARGSTRVPFASHVPTLIETCERIRAQDPKKPFILIIDSLQELDDGHFGTGRKTTKTAYRALDRLNSYCKQTECALLVIGQVTKSGQMAGSNDIKHLIDAHLHLSVEQKDEEMRGARILQATKNRFAGCGQLVFLQMKSNGLQEIARLKESSL